MGYNLTKKSIMKVHRVLDTLIESDTHLQWDTPNAKKLAYHIREGIESAVFGVKHGWVMDGVNNSLQLYAELKSKYIFKEDGTKLIAQLRSSLPELVDVEMYTIRLPDVSTLEQIVGAVMKYIIKGGKKRIVIPNPTIDDSNMKMLEKYLDKKGLEMMVYDFGEVSIKEREGE